MDNYTKTKKFTFIYDTFLTLILAITILWILYVSVNYNSYRLYYK